jgi:hypothetical protein
MNGIGNRAQARSTREERPPSYPVELACEVIPEWREGAGSDGDPAVVAEREQRRWQHTEGQLRVVGGRVPNAPADLEVPIGCFRWDIERWSFCGYVDGVSEAGRWLRDEAPADFRPPREVATRV